MRMGGTERPLWKSMLKKKTKQKMSEVFVLSLIWLCGKACLKTKQKVVEFFVLPLQIASIWLCSKDCNFFFLFVFDKIRSTYGLCIFKEPIQHG